MERDGAFIKKTENMFGKVFFYIEMYILSPLRCKIWLNINFNE